MHWLFAEKRIKTTATAMSTFLIFVIVLTLGYLLYYLAMIAFDVTAAKKSEAATEETIETDEDDDEDEFAPRNVSENTASGGFSISDPDASDVEEAPEEISEADEQPIEEDAHNIEDCEDSSETEIATSSDVEDASDIEEPDDEQPSEEQSSEEENPSADDDQTEDAATDGEPEAPSDADGEAPVITVVKYSEEQPAEKQEEEPFDEDKAFDKTLFTPKYDVTEIVGPVVSQKILSHAIETNAAMSSIVTKANCAMDAQTFCEAMRQGSNNKYGIETTDEVQKY